MPFLLLMVLALACVLTTWPTPVVGKSPELATFASWSAVGMVVVIAGLVARSVRRALLFDPSRRETILRRYSTFRIYHLFGLIVVYLLALYGLGWGWVVRQTFSFGPMDPETGAPTGLMFPGAELLLLAPFAAGLLWSWACFYDAERAIHDSAVPLFSRPFWSRGAYVTFHARQNLALVIAPLTLLILAQGLLRLFPQLENNDFFPLTSYILLVAVFVCLPWILRVALGLRPLPAGPLRDRLLAAARRLNFRCSDILLWNTYSGVANAMVVGVLPRPRYVVLSDRLVAGLTEDELEAVFGHEVGHVKHYHMLYYLSFLFSSLVVLFLAASLVGQYVVGRSPELGEFLRANSGYAAIPFVPVFVLYTFVVFGFLSRRCERQADIYGCRAVSCASGDCHGHEGEAPLVPAGRSLCPTGIRTFIRALEKVADLNGISRSKPGWLQSWQHSTIARRVDFLQGMLGDPSVEPAFQKRVGQVKWALLVGLAALLVVLLWANGGSSSEGAHSKENRPTAGCLRPESPNPPADNEAQE